MGEIISFTSKIEENDTYNDVNMNRYGVLPTEQEYAERLKSRKAPIYDVETGDNGDIWFPYEVMTSGAPVDGSPYDIFPSKELAEECVKRIGGILQDDFYDTFYMDKSAPYEWCYYTNPQNRIMI